MDFDQRIQEKWDSIFSQDDKRWPPAEVLAENLHLLPNKGDALELACGLAANGFLLAQQGLQTQAWDISKVAVEKLKKLAQHEDVKIEAQVRDILFQPPDENSFDVIVIAHFLNREFIPIIRRALRPGGLVYYQTFTLERVEESGPSNPEFRLAQNELLSFFRDYIIRLYREEGLQGNEQLGFRNKAMIIAQKPLS